MSVLKYKFRILFLPFAITMLWYCASTKTMGQVMPIKVDQVYYESLKGDDIINIYVAIAENPNHITLDSVYFRGNKAKLELVSANLYRGQFKDEVPKKQDIIMSNKPFAEYGNTVPTLPKKQPFELKENECVLSYKQGNTVRYLKIDRVVRR